MSQVSDESGIFYGVNANVGDEAPALAVLESVRCLECGAVYAKPVDGGTVRQNPGCPDCGYVGWVSVSASQGAGSPPLRFDEDRLRNHGG